MVALAIIIIIILCIYNVPNDALSANRIHIYPIKTTILYTFKTQNLSLPDLTTHEERI